MHSKHAIDGEGFLARANPLPFFGMPSVKNRFHAVDIELINYCTNKCAFCCAADKPARKKIMSLESLEIILGALPGFDGNVTLSDTGDPLLLDDLAGKVRLIKKRWPQCTLNVTSTLVVKRSGEFFAELFDSGLDQILLSLYAFSEDDYLKFHGSSKYANVLANLKAIAALGKRYTGRIWLKDLTNFNDYYPTEDYPEKKRKFMDFYHELGFEGILRRNFLPISQQDKPLKWESPIPCNVVWGFPSGRLNIHADLDISPCCLIPNDSVSFGNLKKDSLEAIFNGSAAREFRDKWWTRRQDEIPVCRNCNCYSAKVCNMQEFDRVIGWQAEQLAEKEVIFWGDGEEYRRYGYHFKRSKPIAMVSENGSQGSFEGIPMKGVDFLDDPAVRNVPLVIFAYNRESARILSILRERFKRPIGSIYVCPPSYVVNINGTDTYYDIQ